MSQPRPKLRLLLWFWLSALFGALSGLYNGDPATTRWFVLQFGIYGTLFFALPFGIRLFRRLSVIILALGMVLCTALAIFGLLTAPPSLTVWQVPFFENVNLLSAALTVLTAIAMLIETKSFWRLSLVLIGCIGIFVAGSRASLLAITVFVSLIGTNILTKSASQPSRQHRKAVRTKVSVVLLLLAVGVASLTYIEVARQSEQGNLIRFSNHFEGTTWRINDAAEVKLTADATPAPEPGIGGTRLQFKANGNSRLIMHHGAGLSQIDQTYIGSLYVRADTPTSVVLSTHLASTNCRVTVDWSRCVTPPASGNGRINVQLRIESTSEDADLDIYIWGAQLETGLDVGPLVQTGKSIFLAKLLMRTNNWWQVWDEGRAAAASAAWSLFLQEPLGGVGKTNFQPMFADLMNENGSLARHAHNLVLQMLAESGILGLLALLCPVIGLLRLVQGRKLRIQIFQLLILIMLLNTFDVTYFYAYVYVPLWSWFFAQFDKSVEVQ